MARIGVLGPLTVDGVAGQLPPREQVVLAVLTVRRGEAVSAETLADAWWGEQVPPTWSKALQGCVVQLRKALGAGAIETLPQGYSLAVPADEVDACRFERHVARAQELLTLGEADRAAYVVDEALGLWRGRALAEVDGWEPGRVEAVRLEGLRLDAEELRLDAMVRAGRFREVLAEAQARVAEEPLREHRWTLLALAQYQAGRQGDALRTLHRARRVLAEELGLDPGPDLVALEEAILRQDPFLVAAVQLPEPSPVCPYLGLVPYGIGDADGFFGRDADVSECLRRLADAGVLAVVGPSGSGKSSLVRAGIAAALERDGRKVVVVTPGARPMDALSPLPVSGRAAVLVVDQCEEAVTLCADADERAAFFAALVEHAERAPLVVALRADRLGELSAHPGFARIVERGLFLLQAMGEDDLRAAIEGPARQAGLRLEPGLVDLLVRDVEGEPGALPLLSHALRQTWQRREGRTLTVAGYQASGGIRGAVAQSAEQLYEQAPPEQRPLLRDLLLRLVAPSPEGEPVRSRVPRRVVATDAEHEQIIEQLISARLVTSDEDVVELAHEALARAWPRLRDWLDDDVEGQRIWRHLAGAADSWDAMGRPDSELYRGARLDQAVEWRARAAPDLNTIERTFLDASRHAADAQRRIGRRRRRTLTAVLAGAAAVATALGSVAAVQAGRATSERDRAERASRFTTARELAGAAMTNVDVDADRSLLLALQAVETTRGPDGTVLPEAEEALHAALQAHRQLLSIPGVEHLEFSPDGGRLVTGGENGAIHTYDATTGRPLLSIRDPEAADGLVAQHDVRFSPDGALIASSSGTVWDAASGEEVKTLPFGGPASFSVPFSPDGRFVAAQSAVEGTGVWDVATGEQVSSLDGYGYLAFAPDGGRLLIADNYRRDPVLGWVAGYVVDWRRPDGTDRVVLLGHERANTTGAAWSPDGSMVATSAATEVLVWDPDTAERKYTLTSDAGFTSVAFSPDSRRIATGMSDGTAIVWTLSPDGAKPVLTVAGHETAVTDVDFTPDGRRLATTGADGAAKIWDVTPEGSHEWLSVSGTQGVAYSPDGRFLAASTSEEEVPVPFEAAPADVHLYEIDSGRRIATFRGHEDEVIALEFDPNGARLASAAQDGTARIWDVTGDRPPLTLAEEIPGQPGVLTPVVDVAFSPDGGTVATTTAQGGLIRTWDAATGAKRLTLEDGSGNAVLGNWEIEFSPDGTLLAAPSGDTVYLWASGTGEVVARLSHSADVNDLEFSPDGTALITESGDGSLRIWDAQTWDAERSVAAGLGGARIAFSPRGDRLVTLSFDGTIRLWDPKTLEERLVFATEVDAQGAGPDALAFSPDGSRLAAHVNGTVRIYALDIDDLVDLARERLTRSLTEDECRTYLHLEECPSTG